MPVILYKYLVLIIVGLFYFFKDAQSQDAPMSQYYYNLTCLNPAFVGTTDKARVNTYYRDQWPATHAGFRTFGVSYDMALPNSNAGIGVLVSNEQYAALVIPSFDLIYSTIAQVSHNLSLSMAVQAGVVQKFYNTGELNFESEGERLSKGFNKLYPDFAMGINVFYNNIYGGIAVDHIAQPYQGLQKSVGDKLLRKYIFHLGLVKEKSTIYIKQERVISPNILFQWQGRQRSMNWGFNYQMNALIGGLWLRHNLKPDFDALIFSVGFKTQQLRFAYSYDMNIGKKTTIPLGAHEVSLTKTFEINVKKKYKAMKCPSFLE
jgi:type IX secretion system PorP/SprF family membrane protein